MAPSRATISRWARGFVIAGAVFFVGWQVGVLVGLPHRGEVVLGVLGFVLHTVFGKGYSLIPAYFDRELAAPRVLPVHLSCAATGTALLAVDAWTALPAAAPIGAALWFAGAALFVAALAWTVRDNPTGAETGTGEANRERRPVDRAANAFVPIALAYLLVGSYTLFAAAWGLPSPLDGYPPRASHLLAAGTAALLVIAIGVRLLPRLLVVTPPRPLVAIVLPAGALGPALLAIGLGGGPLFRAAAAVQFVAITGFAALVGTLLWRSDRRRVGRYGVLAGAVCGALAVTLGLVFAFRGLSAPLVRAHLRLALLGFLGLTIVGVAYHFYPPAVGRLPGAGDRLAGASIALLFGGVVLEAGWLVAGDETAFAVALGRTLALVGAVLYAYLLLAAFHARSRR